MRVGRVLCAPHDACRCRAGPFTARCAPPWEPLPEEEGPAGRQAGASDAALSAMEAGHVSGASTDSQLGSTNLAA
jgi:hypothetical protein